MIVYQALIETTPEYLYPILIDITDRISPVSLLYGWELQLDKIPILRELEIPVTTPSGPGIAVTNQELADDTRKLYFLTLRGSRIGRILIKPINAHRTIVMIELLKSAEGNPEAAEILGKLVNGIRSWAGQDKPVEIQAGGEDLPPPKQIDEKTEKRRKEVKELWLQKKLYPYIASAVAVSVSTVKRDLDAMGLTKKRSKNGSK